MKIKVSELNSAGAILPQLNQLDLPGAIAWKVYRLTKAIETELSSVESALKDTLKRCAEKDEDGEFIYILDENGERTDRIRLTPEGAENYPKETLELFNQVVDFPDITFSESDLTKVNIKPSILVGLDPFLVEG